MARRIAGGYLVPRFMGLVLLGAHLIGTQQSIAIFKTLLNAVHNESAVRFTVSMLVVGRLTENRTETAVFKKPKTEPTSV